MTRWLLPLPTSSGSGVGARQNGRMGREHHSEHFPGSFLYFFELNNNFIIPVYCSIRQSNHFILSICCLKFSFFCPIEFNIQLPIIPFRYRLSKFSATAPNFTIASLSNFASARNSPLTDGEIVSGLKLNGENKNTLLAEEINLNNRRCNSFEMTETLNDLISLANFVNCFPANWSPVRPAK